MYEKPITHFGWTGSGYIVTNNNTSAGAYKISGGSNGGYLNDETLGNMLYWLGLLSYIAGWASTFALIAFGGGGLVAFFALASIVLAVSNVFLDIYINRADLNEAGAAGTGFASILYLLSGKLINALPPKLRLVATIFVDVLDRINSTLFYIAAGNEK